jgi:hypothetical protein
VLIGFFCKNMEVFIYSIKLSCSNILHHAIGNAVYVKNLLIHSSLVKILSRLIYNIFGLPWLALHNPEESFDTNNLRDGISKNL